MKIIEYETWLVVEHKSQFINFVLVLFTIQCKKVGLQKIKFNR